MDSSCIRRCSINVVSNAVIKIKSFNSLDCVDQLTATTWFSAAFALACSNESQSDKKSDLSDEEHACIRSLRTTYGLMSDMLVKGEDQPHLTQRFKVTAAAVWSWAFLGFGVTPPQGGWSSFGHMMADLFFLHAFGAACVAEFTGQFA